MKPLVLCILDGCGIREEKDGNAFANAYTPTLDMLFEKFPNSILEASGPAVGLPEGQMGTSEVGHMNLGSGRVALQPLEAITSSIIFSPSGTVSTPVIITSSDVLPLSFEIFSLTF